MNAKRLVVLGMVAAMGIVLVVSGAAQADTRRPAFDGHQRFDGDRHFDARPFGGLDRPMPYWGGRYDFRGDSRWDRDRGHYGYVVPAAPVRVVPSYGTAWRSTYVPTVPCTGYVPSTYTSGSGVSISIRISIN